MLVSLQAEQQDEATGRQVNVSFLLVDQFTFDTDIGYVKRFLLRFTSVRHSKLAANGPTGTITPNQEMTGKGGGPALIIPAGNRDVARSVIYL